MMLHRHFDKADETPRKAAVTGANDGQETPPACESAMSDAAKEPVRRGRKKKTEA